MRCNGSISVASTFIVLVAFVATAVAASSQVPQPDLFCATVLSVPQGEFTNANPPQVRIQVTEVLSGDQKLEVKGYVWATWFPYLCTVGEEESEARWSRQPIEVPKVGTKWLIYQSAVGPGPFERLPDSIENRKTLQMRLQQELAFIETNRANDEQAQVTYLQKRQAWDQSFAEKELREMITAADTIAIGMPSSSSSDQQTFKIIEFLKGTPLFTKPELPYMSVRGLEANPAYRQGLWTRDDRVLLFLREQPVFVVAELSHAAAGRGVMLYSEDRANFIKKMVENDTKLPRRQLIFFGGLADSPKIAESLGEFRTVVSQYSYLPDCEVIRAQYPKADWIIGLDELAGPIRCEVSVQRCDPSHKEVQRQWAGSLVDNMDNVKTFIREQVR